ncbi:MAG: 4Fe-4S dicluster domain-containing protein [Gammaproteobacteria bacterium]|nr:4Fe-4S dicluster domain-containing protein [Gammaproteobacteria bacterium]MCP5298448.1 4Fe-4S dicluster domain-containing protein [Chromatiaceae bacterium]
MSDFAKRAETLAAGYLPRTELQRLLDALVSTGYRCVGPRVRDGAIQYLPLDRADEFPVGVRDHQEPGSYRVEVVDDERCFAWANGPQALKPLTFAPDEVLWQFSADASDLSFTTPTRAHPMTAVIGVRGCDLAALRLQEAHFLAPGNRDPAYAARREALFLVGVDCSHPAATCFCTSTGDGPSLGSGYDLALTELDDGFLVWRGSRLADAVLATLDLPPADAQLLRRAKDQQAQAAAAQQRRMPAPQRLMGLMQRLDHAQWDDVAARCLGCGNCTAVCPSCFCSSHRAEPALDGLSGSQVRSWDSCFTLEHSTMHGRPVRADIRTRYRQWLTHKLAGWQSQYGRSGCVGCGRCITWCPVGIDLTAEAAALLETDSA